MTTSGTPSTTPPQKKRSARILPITLAVLVFGGALAYKGRHKLREMASDVYHQYKDAKTRKENAAAFPPERAEQPLVLYDDKLGDGWQDWSWAMHSLGIGAPVHSGTSAISMTPDGYKGIYFHHDTLSMDGYGSLRVFVQGNADINVVVIDGASKFGVPVPLKKYLKSVPDESNWDVAEIPLADLGVPLPGGQVSGIAFQSATASGQSTMIFDDVTLMPDLALPTIPTAATIAVSVDPALDRHAISPYIYGMAFAPPDFVKDLRLGVNRWGGNDKTRYNWVQGNAVNAGRDWGFRNRYATSDKTLTGISSGADQFVHVNKDGAAATILTVPTIGWVARDTDNGHASQNVPNQGDTPLASADGAILGYDPSANRALTSVRSEPRKGQPFVDNPTLDGDIVYQDEWIAHLKKTFGDAAHGGPQFYEMDNEPDLWDATHTDVHPARMGYDDVLKRYLDYATAVKAVDPTAQILGPVSWGWTGYKFSSLDRGNDNFHTHADQTRHGDIPFLEWFLKNVALHDANTHQRSLDALDIHYYPQAQGVYGYGTDTETVKRRLHATSSFWDPTYKDESWIGEPIRLIPRMKEMIAKNYPGTKLAITEWNLGGDPDISGAVAIADTLGIFGEQGLDIANYWAYPLKDTPGYLAFKIYRNADGHGHGFGDTEVRAVSPNRFRLSTFAAIDTKTGYLTVMMVNKMPKATITVPLTLSNTWSTARMVDAWRIVGKKPNSLIAVPPTSGANHTLTLPPMSVTLYRFAPAGEKRQ